MPLGVPDGYAPVLDSVADALVGRAWIAGRSGVLFGRMQRLSELQQNCNSKAKLTRRVPTGVGHKCLI